MMTILHTETLRNWGGQQNMVLTEAIGLSKRGHKIIIACHRGSVLAQKAKAARIKLYEVNMSKHAHLITVPKLIRIIKKEGVEIVSTHSSVDSWAGGIAAKLTGKRLVRFRHNLYTIGRDPLTRFIYAIPDRFIATSNTVRDILIKRGVKNEKIIVMPPSVNTKIYNLEVEDLRKELNISTGTIVIGNTSGFTGVKGLKYLLQAFNVIHKQIPCILLFAGRLNEPFKSRYLSYVKEKSRNKVVFLGHREDIPNVLKTIDIFIFPSVIDSTPTALIEAMAMEKPVVISDITTFKEFISDEVNGIYFKVKNPKDLAEKVILLMQNENLRKQLSRNARSTILEKFTIDKMIDHVETCYREVINAR